ncbi:hypothetical protein M404DRAFT_991639 [Pisolithus tinctorius Marx 270]|uniref:Uncharacterized protein n=1 Tax=Pisolithus tinctorius Marx 270 TaxID=870435 RepID=A0A0C3KZL3_PISTI|nr:hypothetical protein M404DRAFT_991639 [Pisolithus tinctorius Marx 270]
MDEWKLCQVHVAGKWKSLNDDDKVISQATPKSHALEDLSMEEKFETKVPTVTVLMSWIIFRETPELY